MGSSDYNEIDIPEYHMKLRWTDDRIIIFDTLADKIRDEIDVTDLLDVTKKRVDLYELKLSREGDFYLSLPLLTETDVFSTKGEYILDFHPVSEGHFFYFGLYEIGELTLKDGKILGIKSFETQYINSGTLTDQGIIYCGLRENDPSDGSRNYYLAKIDWTDEPKYLSKEKKPVRIVSVNYFKGHIYVSYGDGSYEILDPSDDRVIKKGSLSDNSLRIVVLDSKLFAVTNKGEVYFLNDDLDIIWKRIISEDRAIHALTLDSSVLHVIDERGYHARFDLNGNLLDEPFPTNNVVYSDCVVLRNWIVYFSTDGLQCHLLDSTLRESCSTPISDPLHRKVIVHSDGIITGDDEGKVRFWSIGKGAIIG